MKLKQTYKGDETPSERLRNKLSPFFTLAQMVLQNPDAIADGPFKQMMLDSANDCSKYANDVRDHIDDAAAIEGEYISMRELDDKRRERMRQEHLNATGHELDDFELDEEDFIEKMELHEEEERPTGFLGILGKSWLDSQQSEQEERLKRDSGLE